MVGVAETLMSPPTVVLCRAASRLPLATTCGEDSGCAWVGGMVAGQRAQGSTGTAARALCRHAKAQVRRADAGGPTCSTQLLPMRASVAVTLFGPRVRVMPRMKVPLPSNPPAPAAHELASVGMISLGEC